MNQPLIKGRFFFSSKTVICLVVEAERFTLLSTVPLHLHHGILSPKLPHRSLFLWAKYVTLYLV